MWGGILGGCGVSGDHGRTFGWGVRGGTKGRWRGLSHIRGKIGSGWVRWFHKDRGVGCSLRLRFFRVDERSHVAACRGYRLDEAGCNAARGCPAERVIDIWAQRSGGVGLLIESGYAGFEPKRCPAAKDFFFFFFGEFAFPKGIAMSMSCSAGPRVYTGVRHSEGWTAGFFWICSLFRGENLLRRRRLRRAFFPFL